MNLECRGFNQHGLAKEFNPRFGLRGCVERRQMCWSDVKLLRDADGTEYLEYCERQTKTRSGEEPLNIKPVKPEGPPEKDPVLYNKFYSEKRPSSMRSVEAPILPRHKSQQSLQ